MMQKMLSLILISIGMVLFFRELIRGHFGEAVVTFLASKFRLEYQDALYIYETVFRENLSMIICIAIIIALVAVLRPPRPPRGSCRLTRRGGLAAPPHLPARI